VSRTRAHISIAGAVHHISVNSMSSEHMMQLMESIWQCGKSGIPIAPFFKRKALTSARMEHGAQVHNSIMLRRQTCRAYFCLAFDSCSILRNHRRKEINTLLVSSQLPAAYISTCSTTESCTASKLYSIMFKSLEYLKKEKNLMIVGVVTDNESAMRKATLSLSTTFPWLVPLGDAAHITQLFLKAVACHTYVKPILANHSKILQYFRKKVNFLALNEVQRSSSCPTIKVLKESCITRWSSLVDSVESCQNLAQYICTVISRDHSKEANAIDCSEAFWISLKLLFEFMKPIRTITNIVQSDQITLLESFQCWSSWIRHVNAIALVSSHPLNNVATDVGEKCKGIITQHFHLHAIEALCMICRLRDIYLLVTETSFPAKDVSPERREEVEFLGDEFDSENDSDLET
jgi:hypothetical protein